MVVTDKNLYEELRQSALYLAERLRPGPGAIPKIPGVDIYGTSIPLNGIAGGDLISYMNFEDRFDLDARIQRAQSVGQSKVSENLLRLKRKAGILVADVAGHNLTDAARALLLHQAFQTAALYEMDITGEITVHLFEQVNMRFCKSTTVRNLAAVPDQASFITLIYGEISQRGRFRFLNAGHPPPLVFSREFNRFVEISPDWLVSYTPIGLQPSEEQADAKRYQRPLGFKERYTVNELNLMSNGDFIFLYTDGLLDAGSSAYTRERLEQAAASARDGTAREICEAIVRDRQKAPQHDDLTLVVIKYHQDQTMTNPTSFTDPNMAR
jgi:hypothetical protein